jgi:hypothetical protein
MFRTFVMSLLATTGVALSAHADTVPVDLTTFLVPRRALSNQDSDPFMFIGRIMDESRPRWDEFEDTLAAFPDTSSCLLPVERDKDVQNLLAFDWKAMESLTGIEVCVFRVVRSLPDPELLEDWLSSQGYRVIGSIQSCKEKTLPEYIRPEDALCRIEGYMSPEDFDQKTSIYDNMSFLTRWLWRGASRQHGINIGISAELRVIDVSATVNTQ